VWIFPARDEGHRSGAAASFYSLHGLRPKIATRVYRMILTGADSQLTAAVPRISGHVFRHVTPALWARQWAEPLI
jgi:hypothetical protein